jgi:hypothetical protein
LTSTESCPAASPSTVKFQVDHVDGIVYLDRLPDHERAAILPRFRATTERTDLRGARPQATGSAHRCEQHHM